MTRARGRMLMAAGAAGRLAYAAGLLLRPDAMAERRLAADERGNAYGRMTTRGFGAVHANVALLTLRSALLDRDARMALKLNISCDVGDLVATLLEYRQGALPGRLVVGSAIVQTAGFTTWVWALSAL